VIAERGSLRNTLAEECRCDWHSGAHRLADRHQVRFEPKRGRVERAPGSAEPALHFISNQESACAPADLFDRVGHALRERVNTAFALQRLQHDRRGRVVDGSTKPVRIV
jgi:hypothetical protein